MTANDLRKEILGLFRDLEVDPVLAAETLLVTAIQMARSFKISRKDFLKKAGNLYRQIEDPTPENAPDPKERIAYGIAHVVGMGAAQYGFYDGPASLEAMLERRPTQDGDVICQLQLDKDPIVCFVARAGSWLDIQVESPRLTRYCPNGCGWLAFTNSAAICGKCKFTLDLEMDP